MIAIRARMDLKFVARRKGTKSFNHIWESWKRAKFLYSLSQGNGNKAWKRLYELRQNISASYKAHGLTPPNFGQWRLK